MKYLMGMLCSSACFALMACGGDSSSNSGTVSNDACSVTSTANSVTMTVNPVNGTSTMTVSVFGTDGAMTAQTVVTTYPVSVDTMTVSSTCAAMSAVSTQGVTVSCNAANRQYTVTTTTGLSGDLNSTLAADQAACDAMNNVAASSASASVESSGSSKSTVSDLTTLLKTACTAANAGSVVTVTSENSDYVCASYSAAGVSAYAWTPLIDDIANAGTCSMAYVTANPTKTMYFSQKDSKIYSCTMDENAEWNWVASESQTALSSAGASTESSSSGGISASTGTSSSAMVVQSSSSAKEKVVTFQDGLMWEPSYKTRVRTFFNTVDEYTFFDSNESTGDSSGWWGAYDDSKDGGSSTAEMTVTDSYLLATFSLYYGSWHQEGSGTGAYYAPDPWPYTGITFSFAPSKSDYVDISSWKGVCVTYTASTSIGFLLKDFNSETYASLNYAAYQKTLPATSTVTTVNIAFSSMTLPSYAKNTNTIAKSLTTVKGLSFTYRNDETGVTTRPLCTSPATCQNYYGGYDGSTTFKLYKLGKYGTCN